MRETLQAQPSPFPAPSSSSERGRKRLEPVNPGHSGMASAPRSGACIQMTLVGLVDSKQQHEQLMHACRALAGKPEQQLLHKESVYKASAAANPGRVNYQLMLRLGKTASGSGDGGEKYVQPMSLLWVGESIPFPSSLEKHLRGEESRHRRLPKPSLRKMIEVEVGHTSEDMLKSLGFEVDYVFIRSGHQFVLGPHGRSTIMISEIHRFQKEGGAAQQQQKTTPKLEVDASGADVPNIFLVELSAVSADESPKSVEGAAVEVLQLADKLSAYIDLNSVDENLATALRPGLPGGYGFR